MSLIEADADMEVNFESDDTMADIKKNLLSELSDASPGKSCDDMPPPPLASLNRPLSDNMKVLLRIRPLKETEKNEEEGCFIVNGSSVELSAPKTSKAFTHRGGKDLHSFKFNQIYDEFTSQKVLFEDGMLPTIKEFIDGQNCLVFAYGVTNSGKTHTMLGSPKEPGIIPRALDVIFNSVGDHQMEQSDMQPLFYTQIKRLSPGELELANKQKSRIINAASKAADISDLYCSWDSLASQSSIGESLIDGIDGESGISIGTQENLRFSVFISMAEIYNEQVFDLLQPHRKVLTLREDKKGNPYIKDLSHVQACSAEEAMKVMAFGQRSLQYACTKLNENSSRSHCILTVKIVRVVDVPDPRKVQMSQLSFCDLAGSERYTRTGSDGERLKEAGNINTSLLTLGRCIQLLRENQLGKASKVVPFRESKLTRLFQTFFSGKGRACMLVNVCPGASSYDENMQVFKFSAIARRLKVIAEKVAPLVPSKAKADVSQSSDDCRDTIQWGTIEDQEDKQEGSVAAEQSVEKYQEWVQKLKQALIETNELLKKERKASKGLESRLRAEIVQEMMEHFTEVESSYQQQLATTRQRIEDAAEQRIHIITSAMKKSAESNSENEADIEAVQNQLEHKDIELEAVRKELEEMKKVAKSDEQAKQESLKGKIEDLEKEIVSIKHKHSLVMEEKRKEHELTVKDLELEVVAVSHGLQASDQLKEQAEKDLSAMQEQLEQVMLQAESSKSETEQLRLDIAKRTKEYDALVGEMEELKQTLHTLSDDVDNSKEMENKCNTLTSNMKKLQDQLRRRSMELQGDMSSVQTQLLATGKELSRVKADKEKLLTESSGHQSRIREQQLEIAVQGAELEKLKEQVAELTSSSQESQSTIEELTKDSTTLTVELSERRASYAAASKELSSLRDLLQKSETQSSLLEATVYKLRKELSEQADQLDELKASAQGTDSAVVEELEARLQSKESETHDLKDEVENLRDALDKANDRCAQYAPLAVRVKDVSEKLDEHKVLYEKASQKISELTAENLSLQGETCKFKQQANLVQRLEQQVQTLTKEVEGKEQKCSSLQVILDARECQWVSESSSHEALKQQAEQKEEKLTAENSQQQEEITSLKDKLAKLESDALTMKAGTDRKVSELQAQIESLSGDLQASRKKVAGLETKAPGESVVDELRSVLQEQERTMKVQDEVIECKEEKIHKLKTEICDWNLKCQEYRDIELEKSSLSAKLTSITSSRDLLQVREGELTEEVHTLQQKYDKLSTENAALQSQMQNGAVQELEKEELEELRQTAENNKTRVAEQDEKIEKLEEKVSRKDKIILQLENKIRSHEATIHDMIGGSARSTRSRTGSSDSRLNLADKIATLEADLKQEQSQHAETQRTLDRIMLAKDEQGSNLKAANNRLQEEINRLSRRSDRFKEPSFTNDHELSASTLELDVTPMSSSKKQSKSNPLQRKSTRISALKDNASSTSRTSTFKRRLQEIVEKSTSPLASPAKKMLQVKLTPLQCSESTSSLPTRRRRKLYNFDQSMLSETPSEERPSAKKARELREVKNIEVNVLRNLRSSQPKF